MSGAARREGCIFCEMAASAPAHDRDRLILYRGHFNLIVLNLFPYNCGHAMIAPYRHTATLAALDTCIMTEMMELMRDLETALKSAYQPQGYNFGMNLGRAAGAGIEDHLHLHVLPRWNGDANFMTTVGEARVLPEDLGTTYEKLAGFFRDRSIGSGAETATMT